MVIEDKLRNVKRFRDFLRSKDKEVFDDLLNQCQLYAPYTRTITSPVKEFPFFIAMLFEQHKRLMELERKMNVPCRGIQPDACERVA
jgi:hypothetical protein